MKPTVEQLKRQHWYIKDCDNITEKEKFLLDCTLEAVGFGFIPSYEGVGYCPDTYQREAYIGYRYDYGPEEKRARLPYNPLYHNVVYAVSRSMVDQSIAPWRAFTCKEMIDLLQEHIKKEVSL